MSDVCRAELQLVLDDLSKFIKKNRNHLAADLYRQMHRNDWIGDSGYLYAENSKYDIEIRIIRKKNNEN